MKIPIPSDLGYYMAILIGVTFAVIVSHTKLI